MMGHRFESRHDLLYLHGDGELQLGEFSMNLKKLKL